MLAGHVSHKDSQQDRGQCVMTGNIPNNQRETNKKKTQ